MTERRERLAWLTARWRARHGAPMAGERRIASPERQALAGRAFPYLTETPRDYVARHGQDMDGFMYDRERYADLRLDAWLLEAGRLLRARRSRPDA